MPLVRNRLDCCICIEEQTQDAVCALLDVFGSIQNAHRNELVIPCASFHSCSFEQSERPRLYANHQGGYRVRCPFCSHNIASEFSKSVHKWRNGGDFLMTCSTCKERFPLSNAQGSPPFAFSRAAIILHDVELAEVGDCWHARFIEEMGSYQAIFRRVG
ncbi:MAG: hypothetical protein CL916_06845 [Deltaproteobacteria bacterium]|nr:hypothetical protein [Deltaproteobacteria bacterium]